MSDLIQRLIAFAKKQEPDGKYFGPGTLIDILHRDPAALLEFRRLFDGVVAEQLDDLEGVKEYGWIIAGAADEFDLLPDDSRLFKSGDELANIPTDELLEQLCTACVVNDIRAVENIAKRVDVNFLDHNKQSALGYAIGNNHIECVRILLRHKAKANAKINFGPTPMHLCAATGSSKEIWQLLIEHGGNPDKLDDQGQSARQILKRMRRGSWDRC